MKIFFHHIANKGVLDLPKSVFRGLDTRLIQENAPKWVSGLVEPHFPSGVFSCWGVPAPASGYIASMEAGDHAFLLDYATDAGLIRAIVQVRAYVHTELEALSEAVWGSLRYPYIFFFETPAGSTCIRWRDFQKQVGFSESYNPAGRFHVITSDRLAKYGGEQGYLNYLRQNKYVTD